MELREQCADEAVAAQTLPTEVVANLKHRIADIRAADSMEEVIAGKPRQGTYNGEECYFIDLGRSHELTLVQAHVEPRRTADGALDWSRTRRVKVVSLKP
ncbi:hypothetical protein Cthiooxydans_47040 [Comamonas thiooxydans]|nr:hypothetical protein Cthiooxydans_47040 [Comamonas thiooxydans]